jgi:NAD(P)-dependent dehydrogenase (short-subunit alcohol dehydrogenase family)
VPPVSPDAVRSLAPASLFALDGRVAVVTGAAGGIGQWLAAGLGAAGASLLLTDLDTVGLEQVAGALSEAGLTVETEASDLTDDGAPSLVVSAAVERLGRIDVIVNNAAVNRRMPMVDMDRETFDWIVALDLRAPYLLAQAAARAMIEAGHGGAIVNLASINAEVGLEQISVYGPAKAGLAQLTKVMAAEWTRHGIRANAIAPGFMDTPLAEPIWADPERRRWILNRVPMERLGRPDELVGLCLLLASDAGSFVTGQTLVADGGFLAAGRWFTPDR